MITLPRPSRARTAGLGLPLLALLLVAPLAVTASGCATVLSPASAQTPAAAAPLPHEAAVDALMTRWDREDSPGAVVGVIRDGEVVFAKGYGMANLPHAVPNTVGTRFNIGSISKQFTAFALTLLEARGELSLDDPVREYLPELPEFDDVVTLRHVLTHTSGYRETYGMGMLAGMPPGHSRYPREGVIDVVRRQTELEFPAGSTWRYNSSAYVLLAMVIERVTGEPFPKWMDANVFEPIGMDRTVVEPDVEAVIPGAADSYTDAEGEGYLTGFGNRAYWGAADIYTTVADLAKWLENLDTGEVGGRAVQQRMRERFVLTSGDTLSYALGVRVAPHRGFERLQHGGSQAGYRAFLSFYPELDVGVVVMSNYDGVAATTLGERVEEIFFGDRLESVEREAVATGGEDQRPDALQAVSTGAVPTATLDELAGRYQIPNGPPVTVEREGDRLRGRLGDRDWFGLVPVADTVFVVEADDAAEGDRIVFRVGPDGRTEGATAHINGRAIPMSRAQWSPDPNDLAEFTGRYLSPEIETVYTLHVRDGRLVAEHRWNPALALVPVEQDVFVGTEQPQRIEFQRDPGGAVTGFRASLGRAAGVWFERLD